MYAHIQKIGNQIKKHLMDQEHRKGMNRIAINRVMVREENNNLSNNYII
jgi:hypothetical protein